MFNYLGYYGKKKKGKAICLWSIFNTVQSLHAVPSKFFIEKSICWFHTGQKNEQKYQN